MEQTTKPEPKQGQSEASGPGVPTAVFEDIVCAVDGSRGSQAAARQAVALSGAGGSLRFVAVHHTVGVGLNEQSSLGEHRARKALEEAKELAGLHGLRASSSLVSSAKVAESLRAAVAGHGLLVIGSHGGSRLGGIMLGATVTQLAHRCAQPLLIARPTVDNGDFPARVLLATDGFPGSWAAARTAIQLVSRRAAEVEVVFAPDGEGTDGRHNVLAQRQAIEAQTGTLPAIHTKSGAGAGAHLPSRPGEPGFADCDRQARPRWRQGARQRQRARRPPCRLLGPAVSHHDLRRWGCAAFASAT